MGTVRGRRIVCLIAGMHRSGTSMMSSLVQALGYYGGRTEGEQLGPAHDNVRGYFEHREVVQVNNQLLERLGGSSAQPPSILTENRTTWWDKPDLADFRQRAYRILQSLFAHSSRIVLKDPRLSLTLPLWYFPEYTYRVIVMVRHPLSVARSLIRRGDAFTLSEALTLWETYHSLLHSYLEQLELTHMVIEYERFVRAPFSWVVPLFRFLDIPVDYQGVRAVFTQVMAPLQTVDAHPDTAASSSTPNHPPQQSNLPGAVQSRWEQLQRAMPDPEPFPPFTWGNQELQDLYSAVSTSYRAVITFLQQAYREERTRARTLQHEVEHLRRQRDTLEARLQAIYQSRLYRLMQLVWKGTRWFRRPRPK